MVNRRELLFGVCSGLVCACGRRVSGSKTGLTQAAPRAGDPLDITGSVVLPDGVTPATEVVVYVYHTGTDGLYPKRPGGPPRYRAWLRTDQHGSFGYRTIIPAAYPTGRPRPHVHYQLWGGGLPVQWSSTVFVDGESRLRRSSDGVWRDTHGLTAKATADDLQQSIRHGVRDDPKTYASRVTIRPR